MSSTNLSNRIADDNTMFRIHEDTSTFLKVSTVAVQRQQLTLDRFLNYKYCYEFDNKRSSYSPLSFELGDFTGNDSSEYTDLLLAKTIFNNEQKVLSGEGNEHLIGAITHLTPFISTAFQRDEMTCAGSKFFLFICNGPCATTWTRQRTFTEMLDVAFTFPIIVDGRRTFLGAEFGKYVYEVHYHDWDKCEIKRVVMMRYIAFLSTCISLFHVGRAPFVTCQDGILIVNLDEVPFHYRTVFKRYDGALHTEKGLVSGRGIDIIGSLPMFVQTPYPSTFDRVAKQKTAHLANHTIFIPNTKYNIMTASRVSFSGFMMEDMYDIASSDSITTYLGFIDDRALYIPPCDTDLVPVSNGGAPYPVIHGLIPSPAMHSDECDPGYYLIDSGITPVDECSMAFQLLGVTNMYAHEANEATFHCFVTNNSSARYSVSRYAPLTQAYSDYISTLLVSSPRDAAELDPSFDIVSGSGKALTLTPFTNVLFHDLNVEVQRAIRFAAVTLRKEQGGYPFQPKYIHGRKVREMAFNHKLRLPRHLEEVAARMNDYPSKQLTLAYMEVVKLNAVPNVFVDIVENTRRTLGCKDLIRVTDIDAWHVMTYTAASVYRGYSGDVGCSRQIQLAHNVPLFKSQKVIVFLTETSIGEYALNNGDIVSVLFSDHPEFQEIGLSLAKSRLRTPFKNAPYFHAMMPAINPKTKGAVDVFQITCFLVSRDCTNVLRGVSGAIAEFASIHMNSNRQCGSSGTAPTVFTASCSGVGSASGKVESVYSEEEDSNACDILFN
jgi:hypothetical protein